MRKRIICIILSLALVLCLFAGCNTNTPQTSNEIPESSTTEDVSTNEQSKVTSSNTTSNKEPDLKEDEHNEDRPSTSIKKDQYTENNRTDIVTQGYHNNTTSVNRTQTTRYNGTTTSKKEQGSTSDKNTTVNQEKPKDLVIRVNNTLYEKTPTITQDYIYPSESIVKFVKNSSNVYENKYVKLDASTGKDGYLLVTYKDPCAEKLWIVLDETASHSGFFEKTHHFRYDKGSFKVGEPIAIPLPKTDAIYYLCVDSEINGLNSDKLVINLGQITVSGSASYQDMVPTEEQIKLVQSSAGIYSNKYVKINTNTASKGYVEVEYIEPNGFDIGVIVTSNKTNESGGTTRWHYYSNYKGKCKIKAALTYGNAEYTITVRSSMKNESTGVGRLSKKAELTINLSNVPVTGAFLLNTGEVIYDSDMMFIKKAAELSAGCKNDFEKVAKIYDWMTDYIRYSVTEDTAVGEYKCDLNKIYNRKTGVCYDYAVVLAAMLRSQGIACKVVFGSYLNSNQGHAWNEVYIPKNGSITTDKMSIMGNKWCTLDPTLSNGNTGKPAIDYMNNSSNYVWQFYY